MNERVQTVEEGAPVNSVATFNWFLSVVTCMFGMMSVRTLVNS